MAIRVLIVDDHNQVRLGLRMYFDQDPDIEIVGEAGDGREAVAAAGELKPHVVLMDLLMPALDGIGATAVIRREMPDIEVVAMTSELEEAAVLAAIEAGAITYALKDAEPHILRDAILAAGAGQVRFPRDSAQRLLRDIALLPCNGSPLEERQRIILLLIAAGHSNTGIAAATGVSVSQALSEVSGLLARLGVAGRAHAILCGIKAGLIPTDAVRALGLEPRA
jgi:two-component system, NarL family, response regulator LiaR